MGRSKVNSYIVNDSQSQLERLQHMLSLLEFGSLPSSLQHLTDAAQHKKATYLDYLESLLETEIAHKEDVRIERWIKSARFPAVKTIDQFNFGAQPSIDERLVRDLASCRFIQSGRNIILFGPPGVGKTHLATAIGHEAIIKGIETRFLTLDRLIEVVRKQDEIGLRRLLRTLTNPPLLIIDDIDYEEPGKNVSLFLHKLITRRHETGASTIITSNKKFSEWEQLFSGDKQKAASAIDRLCGNGSHIIAIDGASYRQNPTAKSTS